MDPAGCGMCRIHSWMSAILYVMKKVKMYYWNSCMRRCQTESRSFPRKGKNAFEVQYVVFVTNAAAISTHPISKYVKNSAAYGFSFVFLEEYEENLPQGCTEIIRLEADASGTVFKAENGRCTIRVLLSAGLYSNSREHCLKAGSSVCG